MIDLGQELLELGGPMPSVGGGDDGAVSDVHRREQARGPVTEVVVGPLRHARHHRERRLRAGQRLHLRLLVHAQDHRGLGRVQVEPDDVVDLLHKQRVIRQLEPVGAVGLETERLPHRPIVDFDSPVRSAIFDRDQCVALLGVDSNVATTTSSTCSAVTVAGRPGRGSSASLSKRCSRKRERHLPTVGRLTPSRAATTVFASPLAHSNTIRERNAKACDDLRRRAQRTSCSRSSSESTNSAFGRPVLAIPHTTT